MLANKIFHYSYSQIDDHNPSEFCQQALYNSIQLDLGLGYFSTASFHILAGGLAHFIANGGCMNLYINQYVTQEDFDVLKGNYDNKFDDELVKSFTQLKSTFAKRDEHFFQCVAYLMQTSRINVKIIVLRQGGLPHEKYGIFTDECGNKIYFTGSMNMTAQALLGNLETIECTCSWKGEDSQEKVFHYEQHFNKVWNGECSGVIVYEAKKFCNEIIKAYPQQNINSLILRENELIKKIQHANSLNEANAPHFPLKYSSGARQYQKDAYNAWIKNGKKGIFAMATGTGKTITSLNCALCEFEKDGFYNLLILVPTIDLVDQWKDELINFNFKKTLVISSHNRTWRKDLVEITQKIKMNNMVNFAIISTYDSFKNKDFQLLLHDLPKSMILIADEAHNIGANNVKKCFREMQISRGIGLSATPERIYDEEGSNEIASFFNDKRPYVYSFNMSKAIKDGFLCDYFYYPKIAYLNDEEMEKYKYITRKLALLWDPKTNAFTNKKEAEKLLLNRKIIIHKCNNKIKVYSDILHEIGEENLKYTFVYAPQGKFDSTENNSTSSTEMDDMSFIQKLLEVTKKEYPNKLCNTYTSKESKNKRTEILNAFGDGTLDILLAMKCLDEGVDIPRAERAIFTSSTGNPREFIQRRGRILRNHPEKKHSYIYDIIVIPPTINREESSSTIESNIVRSELKRVAYFASLALNYNTSGGAYDVLNDVARHFGVILSELMMEIKNNNKQ